MPQLRHLPPDTSTGDMLNVLEEDGALIIDDAMKIEQLANLKSEIMPYVEATASGQDEFTGSRTTRTGALAARSEVCRNLIMDRRIIELCDAFLLPFSDRYQLHLTQLIRIMDGQQRQSLHRDRLAWGGFLRPDIEPQLNMIWGVTEFTADNGATCVVPGSHRWDSDRQAKEEEIAFAEMREGSVLIYSGSVIHGGGANISGRDRMGLNITYCLGWLRQEENQYLSCPPEIARHFTPELQAILGYALGSYALGYFTPPLPPGHGPEAVPPNFLFDDRVDGWGGAMLDTVPSRAKAGST
jgi:ectoine hydroxylase-related dioxygenase (phytanoyl-CoA dioxygenase family)